MSGLGPPDGIVGHDGEKGTVGRRGDFRAHSLFIKSLVLNQIATDRQDNDEIRDPRRIALSSGGTVRGQGLKLISRQLRVGKRRGVTHEMVVIHAAESTL